MEIALVGLVLVIAVLLWLLLRAKKNEGKSEAIIEADNVEKEIIEENRKAAWSNLDTINKLDDANVKQLLAKKWTRK
jgi:uncharacterized protein (UPF0333 family)